MPVTGILHSCKSSLKHNSRLWKLLLRLQQYLPSTAVWLYLFLLFRQTFRNIETLTAIYTFLKKAYTFTCRDPRNAEVDTALGKRLNEWILSYTLVFKKLECVVNKMWRLAALKNQFMSLFVSYNTRKPHNPNQNKRMLLCFPENFDFQKHSTPKNTSHSKCDLSLLASSGSQNSVFLHACILE